MMIWRKYGVVLAVSMVMLLSSVNAAVVDQYPFESADKQQQFTHILQELRCLVCQNENLADSNAGLAQDLRAQIYDQIQRGYDEAAIKQYLVHRYGQFILFKPAFNPITFTLWLAPFVVLLMGMGVLMAIMRRRPTACLQPLSTSEQQRLNNMTKP